MASKYNKIEYKISTTLDSKGLDDLQKKITGVQTQLSTWANRPMLDGYSKGAARVAQQSIQQIESVQTALTKAFDPKMNGINADAFMKELSSAGLSMKDVYSSFSNAGYKGTEAFTSLVSHITKANIGLKETSTLSDKLFTSMGNIARWQVMSGILDQFQQSFGQCVDYVKELDDSLTQIRLVTENSTKDMQDFAKQANEAAKSLGATTTDMTNASLVFAQQGFNNKQSLQMAQLSTMLANSSQQDTATTSDQITAYMNAYGLSDDMDSLKKALNAWAEVANVSAADVGEIAQASQRVASTAKTTGVNMDQLNAQIATIESVTREAPEQIGKIFYCLLYFSISQWGFIA